MQLGVLVRIDYENMDPEDFLKILRRVINSQNEITLEDELLASYLEEAGDELPIYAGPGGMYALWRKIDILETGKDMIVWHLVNHVGVPAFDKAIAEFYQLDEGYPV